MNASRSSEQRPRPEAGGRDRRRRPGRPGPDDDDVEPVAHAERPRPGSRTGAPDWRRGSGRRPRRRAAAGAAARTSSSGSAGRVRPRTPGGSSRAPRSRPSTMRSRWPARTTASIRSRTTLSGWYLVRPMVSYSRVTPRDAISACSSQSGLRSRWARATRSVVAPAASSRSTTHAPPSRSPYGRGRRRRSRRRPGDRLQAPSLGAGDPVVGRAALDRARPRRVEGQGRVVPVGRVHALTRRSVTIRSHSVSTVASCTQCPVG